MAAEDTAYIPCRKKAKTVPTSVSCWTRESLESLSIFYNDRATDLSFFVDHLKKLRGVETSTKFVHYLTHLIKNLFTSSVDTGKDLAAGHDIATCFQEIVTEINSFNKSVKKMGALRREELRKGGSEVVEDEMALFDACCYGIRDFLKFFLRFLDDIFLKKTRKGQFTQLFMKFTRIFLLDPEPGDLCAKRKLKVQNTEVLSVPDVLFFQQGSVAGLVAMVMSSEVERINPSSFDDKPFQTNVQDSKMLGQHGGQLLAEVPNSIFNHQVLGTICMKTKVIFTFLDITEDHVEKIETSGNLENMRAHIHYSRPLDFMIAEDRDKMLEIFTLLGFVQSNAYRYFRT